MELKLPLRRTFILLMVFSVSLVHATNFGQEFQPENSITLESPFGIQTPSDATYFDLMNPSILRATGGGEDGGGFEDGGGGENPGGFNDSVPVEDCLWVLIALVFIYGISRRMQINRNNSRGVLHTPDSKNKDQ